MGEAMEGRQRGVGRGGLELRRVRGAAVRARRAIAHLDGARRELERSVEEGSSAYPSDLPIDVLRTLRAVEDGQGSAAGQIAAARRKLAAWVGVLEHEA